MDRVLNQAPLTQALLAEAHTWMALASRDGERLGEMIAAWPKSAGRRPEMLNLHHYFVVRHAYMSDSAANARALLNRIEIESTPPWLAAEIHGLRVEQALADGRILQAERMLGSAPDQVDPQAPALRLASVMVRWLQGKITDATFLANSLKGDPAASLRYQARATAVGAVLHCSADDVPMAQHVWRELQPVFEIGFLEPLDDVPEEFVACFKLDVQRRPASRPRLRARLHKNELTARELIVLGALASNSRVELIAQQLHVSPNTVKTQLRTLYRKLGVHSRDEALRKAVEWGVV
ncbi:LuxR C-terminal-related transcriptional regulator [Microbacterium sp. NPDC076911]|uniref:helix-turn-helix transcriptional regulator n=1 Tax=Microbacterium sp. NPDC076911 TaxID=3154958 RepID=UPI00344448E1